MAGVRLTEEPRLPVCLCQWGDGTPILMFACRSFFDEKNWMAVVAIHLVNRAELNLSKGFPPSHSFIFEKVFLMRTLSKTLVGIATAGLLVAGIAGVSSTANAAAPAAAKAASSIPAPVAAVPALFGGSTGVLLDSGFTGALTSLGLTPGVVGTATLTDGSVNFPITGGSVVYWSPDGKYRPYVQGIIQHDGSGLSLTAGSTVVDLTNFTINPGNSLLYGDVSVNGTVAATQAPLFNLHGGTLKPLQVEGNNAILTGTTVHVSETAAGLLNKVFSTDAVKKGLLVGIATITAQIAQ